MSLLFSCAHPYPDAVCDSAGSQAPSGRSEQDGGSPIGIAQAQSCRRVRTRIPCLGIAAGNATGSTSRTFIRRQLSPRQSTGRWVGLHRRFMSKASLWLLRSLTSEAIRSTVSKVLHPDPGRRATAILANTRRGGRRSRATPRWRVRNGAPVGREDLISRMRRQILAGLDPMCGTSPVRAPG